MKTEKLSLDAFKAMVDKVQTEDTLNQIEGCTWSDCYGFWGQTRKFLLDAIDVMTD